MRFLAAPDLRPVRAGFLIVVLFLAGTAPARAQLYSLGPDQSRQAQPWALAADVTDPMFATMMGVIDLNLFGEIHQAQLDSIVQANGGTKLPHTIFTTMRRTPLGGEPDALIEIILSEAVDRPIPYSLLGYNPGSIRSSQQLNFLEYGLGDLSYLVELDGKKDERIQVRLRDAHLFVISEGFMEMDFDGWLDRMLGSKLDDMRVKAFLTFHWNGQRYSLGMGLSNKNRGKTGAFDFVADETLFPAPKEMLAIGRELRSDGLRRLARWQEQNGIQPDAVIDPDR